MENEFLTFGLIFLRKELNDSEIKSDGEINYRGETIKILFSKKLEKYVLLINLQSMVRAIDYQNLYEKFCEKMENEKIQNFNTEVLFCLLTFKNKFIIYNMKLSKKIYLNDHFFIIKTKIFFFHIFVF